MRGEYLLVFYFYNILCGLQTGAEVICLNLFLCIFCRESPPLSPAMSLSASASVVKIAAYQPVLVPSAATATMLASGGSLSPRPGPPSAASTSSQPKM